jgi:hypothetical protein
VGEGLVMGRLLLLNLRLTGGLVVVGGEGDARGGGFRGVSRLRLLVRLEFEAVQGLLLLLRLLFQDGALMVVGMGGLHLG